jgi:hypothetical protein
MARFVAASLLLLAALAGCSNGATASDDAGTDTAAEVAADAADAREAETADATDELEVGDDGPAEETANGGGDGLPPDAPGDVPATLRVLFVGNSYTFQNDLPARVAAVAVSDSGGPALEVESIAVGGARLLDHLATPATVAAIRDGGWTHVVLQGQSVEPLYDRAGFAAAAAGLAAEVVAAGAEALFYETWARQVGSDVYAESWSGGTPAAMQAGLRDAYAAVAAAAGGRMVPVGDAWERALAEHPTIGLFDSDGSHPSPAGTYLAACVFHAVLSGRRPSAVDGAPPGLAPADAAELRTVAEATVFP